MIYICELSTGEYEDKRYHTLCAFEKKSDADEYAENIIKNLMKLGFHRSQSQSYDERLIVIDGTEYRLDVNGGSVYVYSIKFKKAKKK